jgi:hypothetical protein
MAAPAILVVVAVRDAGLRSALAAHLSLDGFELLTASGIGYGLLGSTMVRAPAILVIDETLIPCDPDRWIEKQRSLGDWRHLVVLTGAAPRPVDGGAWLVRIAGSNARKLLSELLAGWANDESRAR